MTSLGAGLLLLFFFFFNLTREKKEIAASKDGVVFKRWRPHKQEHLLERDEEGRVVVGIHNLPLYIQYIAEGTPAMMVKDANNEPDLDRPRYSVISDACGQAPWVREAGFSFQHDDCVEPEDFFDTSRHSSIDGTYYGEDGLVVMYDQMFMVAYMLVDPKTKAVSCKRESLLRALIDAPDRSWPPNFVFE